ncbi:MAG: type II secretion system F family protein [Lachnospiraceae bacterium]|nr:type II secretion system F family protein [Lachnospiraceae bacterium]
MPKEQFKERKMLEKQYLKAWSKTKFEKWLYQMAYFLYQNWKSIHAKYNIPWSNHFDKKRKQREELQCLEPMKEIAEVELRYSLDKIKLGLLIALVGLFVILCSVLSAGNAKILIDGNYIERKSYGKGELNTTLIANVIDETTRKEEIEILVNERKYTDEELTELYQACRDSLYKVILGENQSLDAIQHNMILPAYLQEYPFRIVWESSDYTVINPDGILGEKEVAAEGEPVSLTANLTYFDWKEEAMVKIIVYPPKKSEDQLWNEKLKETIAKRDIDLETAGILQLPTTFEGKEIKWEEIKKNHTALLFALLVVIIIVLCIAKDREIQEKIEERRREMIQDYPEIIGKLSLLIGAGMSMRRAWIRIAKGYADNRQKKRYAYEEMLITAHEMDSGISESKSYDNFAKRCRVQCYLKLGTLLSQNLKKGSANLQRILQEEAKEAFEERKIMAKRAGEEAGTKLLLPMMLMLGIVMVVVIVPAFLSFSI